MICELCSEDRYCLWHHICYDPEIVIYVCPACHYVIHHGSLGYLDPCRAHKQYMPVSRAEIIDRYSGEILLIPIKLQRYAEIAMDTRINNRIKLKGGKNAYHS